MYFFFFLLMEKKRSHEAFMAVPREQSFHVFEGKVLPDVGHRNPAFIARGDLALLAYVLSDKECLWVVVDAQNPWRGWSYRGEFSRWASSSRRALVNLHAQDVMNLEFGCDSETGKVDYDSLYFKINVAKCREMDNKLTGDEKSIRLPLEPLERSIASKYYMICSFLRSEVVLIQVRKEQNVLRENIGKLREFNERVHDLLHGLSSRGGAN